MASRDPRSRSMGSKGFPATVRHPPPPSRIFYRYSDLEVSCTPTINEPSHRATGDPGHRRLYYSSHSLHDKWPLAGRCNTWSWKPSLSNGWAIEVRHQTWWTKGVAALSI
jgi:hypothetical protein